MMNKTMLTVQGYLLYPENYTKDQLKENYRTADAAARAAYYADLAAYAARAADAVYLAADAAAYAADLAVHAARAADAVYLAADAAALTVHYAARVEYWINKYFELTGENRQDYIDAINKDNKQ
jgi:hypothetical protein